MARPRTLRAPRYIWQQSDWPQWRFDVTALAESLALVHWAQGQLMGRMAELERSTASRGGA